MNPTEKRLRELLAEVLQGEGRVSKELRTRIHDALTRGPGGPGRKRALDYDRVRRLAAAGKSPIEIATALKTTRQAIDRILRLQDE